MDDGSASIIVIVGIAAALIIQYFIIKAAVKAAITETGLAKSTSAAQQGHYGAGWYVDPRDQTIERYFDGTWTASTRPRTQT